MAKRLEEEEFSEPPGYGLAFDLIAVTDEGEEIITGPLVERGGPGSGHHGHKGREGKVGGSLPADRDGDTDREEFDRFLSALADRHGLLDEAEGASELERGAGIWIDPRGDIFGAGIGLHASSARDALEDAGIKKHPTTYEGYIEAFTWAIKKNMVRVVAMRDGEIGVEPGRKVTEAQKRTLNQIFLHLQDWGVFVDSRYITTQAAKRIENAIVSRGGPGSGFHGHKGRPGEVGGSLPADGGGVATATSTKAQRKIRLRRLFNEMKTSDTFHQSQIAMEFLEAATSHFAGRDVEVVWERIDETSRTEGIHIYDGDNVLTAQYRGASGASETGEVEMVLSWIDAKQKGTGLGTAFMRSAKAHADATGRSFRVIFVTNPTFYRKFEWLKEVGEGGGSEFLYTPGVAGRTDRAESDDDSEEYDLTESPHDPKGKTWTGDPVERGGPGSGHHGHEGRPGEVGGSKPAGGRTRLELGDKFVAVKVPKDKEPYEVFVEENNFDWHFQRLDDEIGFGGFTEKQARKAREVFESQIELAIEDAALAFFKATGFMPEGLLWTDNVERIVDEMYGDYGEEAKDENRSAVVHGLLDNDAKASFIGDQDYPNIQPMIHLNVQHAPSSGDLGMGWLGQIDDGTLSPEDTEFFDTTVQHELGHWLTFKSGLQNNPPEGVTPSVEWQRTNWHYPNEMRGEEYQADLIASLVSGHMGLRNDSREPDAQELEDRDAIMEAIRFNLEERSFVYRQEPPPPTIINIYFDDDKSEGLMVNPDDLATSQRVFKREGDPPAEFRGGPGSGHHGHKGRPGEVGGSQPDEGGGQPDISKIQFQYREETTRDIINTDTAMEAYEASGGRLELTDGERRLWALILGPVAGETDRGFSIDDIDLEQEIARVVHVYDYFLETLADPANAKAFIDGDRAGESMVEFVKRWQERMGQIDPDNPFQRRDYSSLNIVLTNDPENVGAGSSDVGSRAVKVFWQPTTLSEDKQHLETGDASFKALLSPASVLIHELHHGFGSPSELDTFSTALTADYLLNNREILTPQVERDLIGEISSKTNFGARRASGEFKDGILRDRAMMGWLYSRNSDYIDTIIEERRVDFETSEGTDRSRGWTVWTDLDNMQKKLRQWAKEYG